MFNLMTLEKIVECGLTSFEIPFGEPVIKGMCRYITELKKWNERINLVGMNDEESIVRELLYDTFFLNGYVKGNESILDMGSGAGALAIPLKILNEEMRVCSIDKTLKKIQFQRHVQRTLKFTNFYPVLGRIEFLKPLNVHGLVAKAFGSITDILAKGGGHITRGGLAFLLKGKTQKSENVEGFVLEETIPYTLLDSTKDRTLFIYRKQGS
jgi:16S rRNA (guanine527-N7)-methyltransferase